MAALHEALKTLAPCDYADIPLDNLSSFLTTTFQSATTILESVPIASPPSALTSGIRSRATSTASNSSEISSSPARSSPPTSSIEVLQKEWKQVKLGASQNPLDMSVYKMGGKDGRGAWFARRSVHEGLGFKRWKAALMREFPKSMETQGGPGEGNIRGIGGEVRVAEESVDGVGKVEVYLLSAQFPGPTAPRDFVTMLLTSDNALEAQNDEEAPRHFMVVSKPCKHPDAAPRDGYIRGQYESVEFIREIPSKKPRKSVSTTELDKGHARRRSSTLGRDAVVRSAAQNYPDDTETVSKARTSSDHGRSRGKTISFDHSRGSDAKGEEMDNPKAESEENPVEWIMITRSDPGGSVPRFMIDRGTPGGIVSDAGKFLDWACGSDLDDFEDDDEPPKDGLTKPKHLHKHDSDLHSYQTNGHLAGLEEEKVPAETKSTTTQQATTQPLAQSQDGMSNSGLLGMVTGGIGAAGGFIASHTPEVITSHLPALPTLASTSTDQDSSHATLTRRTSSSSISTVSSTASFTSALETRETDVSKHITPAPGTERELAKLDSKKRKLDEKLEKTRQRENSRASDDSSKQDVAIAKAAEKHDREVKKQEDKYKKEVLKLQHKKEKEERKTEERKRREEAKDERAKLMSEINELKAANSSLQKDKEGLRMQVGELQKENTLLAARVGKLGGKGEEILREVKDEVGKSGRSRSSSLRVARPAKLERKITDIAVAKETRVNGTL